MKKTLLILLLMCFFTYSPKSYGAETTLEYNTNVRITFGFGNNYDLQKFSKFALASLSTKFPNGYTMFDSKGIWHHPEKGIIRENNVILLYNMVDSPEAEKAITSVAEEFLKIFKNSGGSVYIVKTPILTAKVYF